jgi:hypothetical protein
MKINVTLTILLSIMSLFTVTLVYSQEVDVTDSQPEFLALHHAQSGSISEINKTFTLSLNNESNKTIFSSAIDKSFLIRLNNISDKTILFSDRPDRIITSISTLDFIGNWSKGQDSFAVDAPNAVLIVDDLEGKQGNAIMELFHPVYDLDERTLTYQAISNQANSIYLQTEFGQSTLMIDATPGNYTFKDNISQKYINK